MSRSASRRITDTSQTQPAARTVVPRAGRRDGLLLVLMCSTQFLNVANISSVNIALPDIAADLGFSAATLRGLFRPTCLPSRASSWSVAGSPIWSVDAKC